ncbi:MAG: pyridoxal-phosphate dependent enzyme [Pseudomonadota bacterium]
MYEHARHQKTDASTPQGTLPSPHPSPLASPLPGDSRRTQSPGGRLFGSVLETIGDTPVVRLNALAPAHVDLYAKLEAFNPMGSVKDRLALAVIETAERTGALRPGQTVIEATSGNTGIGLAMVCARKGYPLVIVMAENFSVERRRLMRFLGAKVILTSAADRGTGMFATAEKLAEKHGWFFTRQFENEANAEIHAATTAREILSDFGMRGLDYWVTGAGTGGTLNGVARVLKAESPRTRIVVAEPENAQILSSDIPQQRRADGAAARSHPMSRAHPVQGWTPDFVPKLADDAKGAGHIDRFVPVSGHEALRLARALATREGIFSGISGGATLAAALEVAEKAPEGTRILAMIPDTGERYLSTPLFEDIPAGMTEEEREIAASVPPLRRQPAAESARPAETIDPEAAAFVDATLSNAREPVVMVGFEWCEFCWSVRRLFQKAGIPFRALDIDTAAFREGDRGGKVLRAVFARTGVRTVPQVFVAGTRIGGATDTLAAFVDGSLQSLLARLDPPITPKPVADPMAFLPTWTR